VTSEKFLPKVQATAKPDTLQHTIVMEGPQKGVLGLDDLVVNANPPSYARTDGLDTATIIYTSGTTGEPKGAVMTHNAIAKNIDAIDRVFRMSREGERLVSYLPLSHCYERFAGDYTTLLSGGSILFSDKDRLGDDVSRFNPTIFLGVPLVYEKMQQKVQAKFAKWPGFLRDLGMWLFKGKVRKACFGRNIRFATSSAAALKPEVGQFVRDYLKVDLLEAYGMTEAVSAICANTPADNVPGTVGKPLPGYDIRLGPVKFDPNAAGYDLTPERDGKGEVHFRGPRLFMYYKNPEATNASTTPDGWWKTGDIGELIDGRLRIVGRVKEHFKLATGEYVEPDALESRLKDSPYVGQAFIYGDDQRKYVIALIVPNERALGQKLGESKLEALVNKPEAEQLFKDEVARLFKEYKSFKQPTTFALLPDQFTVENGMLTPTLKMKRREILKKYKPVIDKLYEGRNAPE
jgi:long-chain acyl-CoA synthetase